MAKQDNLVTLRTDGEIKAIMRGEECVRYVMEVENHRIDPEGFDIFKGSYEAYANFLEKAAGKKRSEDSGFAERKLRADDDGKLILDSKGHCQLTDELKKAIDEANSSTVFEELFGVVWVGISPYHVFTYKFRWLKFGQKKATSDGTPSEEVAIHAREEEVDSLFFRYPQYGVVIKDAETGAGTLSAAKTDKGDTVLPKVKVKATFVFETVTVNPQKTLFRTAALSSAGDWQQALVREINDRGRMWLGSTDWDTLVGKKDQVEKALKGIRDDINGIDEHDLPLKDAQTSSVRDYGQKIVKITMPNVDLIGEGLQEAYEAVFKAEKKRDADIADAAGKRALAAAPVLGKADGLAAISKLDGGKEMYMAEQLGNIRVYAPGRDGLLLNIAEEVTGSHRQSTKKTKVADSSGGSKEES